MAEVIVPRTELDTALRELGEIKLRDNLLPNAVQLYREALDIINGRLGESLTEAIQAGVDVTRLTDVEVKFSEENIQRLLVIQALLATLFPEFAIQIAPFIAGLRTKLDNLPPPPAPTGHEVADDVEKGYPHPQNDFEQFLQSQGVPPEIFRANPGESDTDFYNRKYREMQKYFFSIVINQSMTVADVSGTSLWFPNILKKELQVRGVQQGKTAEALIATMTTLDNPLSAEKNVANVAAKKMRDKCLVIGSWASALETMKANDFSSVRDVAGLSKFYSSSFPEAAYLRPGGFLSQLDFPLVESRGGGEWGPQNEDAETVRDKIFKATKEILDRRRFPEDRYQGDGSESVNDNVCDLYKDVYMRAQVYPPHDVPKLVEEQIEKNLPPRAEFPEAVILRENLFPAFHYLKNGRRWQGRKLKFKRLPSGPDGALYPRISITKDTTGQQEAVRRNILRVLSPKSIQTNTQDNEGWRNGETEDDFMRRTENADWMNHKPAVFALMWAEMMGEVALESYYQDARVARGKEKYGENLNTGNKYRFGRSQRGVAPLNDVFNPSTIVAHYESGGEKAAKINSFMIGWQSFLLDYYDYFLLRGQDGKVFTLAQHILRGEKFEDVPWNMITDEMIRSWIGQMDHMGAIASVCMNGFQGGGLRNLSEVNTATNEVNKINEKLTEEIIKIFRNVSAYMLGAHASPGSFLGFERKIDKQNELALESGQFMKIRVEYVNPKNPVDTWKEETVTRVHQYLIFDEKDILDWIPRNRLTKRGTEHFAGFITEKTATNKVPYRTLLVRVGALPGETKEKHSDFPKPEAILTREIMTRIFSASAGTGDTLKSIKMEDLLVLGIMFSDEVRQKYREKYFTTVGKHLFTQAELFLVDKLKGMLQGRIIDEDIMFELPQSSGPNLFTMEQFMVMLEKMGYKITFEELLHAGKSLIGAISGKGKSKK